MRGQWGKHAAAASITIIVIPPLPDFFLHDCRAGQSKVLRFVIEYLFRTVIREAS